MAHMMHIPLEAGKQRPQVLWHLLMIRRGGVAVGLLGVRHDVGELALMMRRWSKKCKCRSSRKFGEGAFAGDVIQNN